MIVFEYLGIAVAGYALLFYLGWPLWTALAPSPAPLSTPLAAPLTGLAVLQVFSWYWLEHSESGLNLGLPILLGLNLVAAVVVLIWRPPKLRFDHARILGALVMVGVIGASTILVVSNFQVVVRRGDHLVSASFGNNDLAAYVEVTRFIHDHGVHSRGPIANYNLGSVARDDVSGAFAFLASTAMITGVQDWQATLPVMFVAVFLGILALKELVDRVYPGSRIRAALIGLIASASYFYAYVQGQYFLSQVIAMGTSVVLLVMYVELAKRSSTQRFIRNIAIIALLDLIVLQTYSHMLFLALPILLAAVLVSRIGPGWVLTARRVVSGAALGFLLAVVVCPQRFNNALHKLTDLATGKYGYPLPALTPFQLLGFQRVLLTPPLSRLLIEGAIVLLVAIGAAAVIWRTQRRVGIFCVSILAMVLGSYGFIYLVRGKSYTQFKWISFFQPLYTAVGFLVLCAAAVYLLDRVGIGPTIRAVAGGIAGIALLVVIVNNTRELTKPDSHWLRVPPSLAALEDNPKIEKLGAINVQLPPYWDSMWATYFLWGHKLYMQNPSYYPITEPRARWTLEPTSTVTLPGQVVRPLNADYKLVRDGS